MRRLAKVLVFSLVCLVTWSIASRLIAHPDTAGLDVPKIVTAEAIRGIPLPAPANARDLQPVSALIFMPKIDVQVEDGVAYLSATASIRDVDTSQLYAWRLQIYNAGGQQIHSHLYGDQVFGMEPDGSMEPKFADTFPLPAGSKHVALSLYILPKEIGMAAFESEERAAPFQSIRGVKQVSR